MAISIGIGIPNILTAAGPSLGTTIATTHYNRVIADGGVVPAGISGLSSILNSVISAYSITGSSDFNTKVPVFLDPHYTGYKLGAGSGTTLGQAARTVYAINSSADVTQATAASQPLLLAHSGTNYWWGSGVNGNYVSTPNAAANQITGDIELKACINIGAIVGGDGLTPLICKPNSYYMLLYNNYVLKFYNGTTVSAATTTIPTNTTFTKITRSSSTGDINFYTSNESITTNINSVTWTKLGTTVSSTAGNLPTSSDTMYVGAAGGAWSSSGKIYRATISNSIGGTPVVDFNPSSYSASTSQTAWTSSTGEVWTINKSTGQTLTGVLVDKSQIQVVRALLSMATGTGTTFLSGNNVLYSQYVVAKGCENQVQQSPISLRGTGSSGTDFTSASSNRIAFYGIDNAGAVRRFDPANAANFNLALYTIIGDTTTTAYQNNNIGAASSSSTTQGQTTINQIKIGTAYNYNGFTGNIASIIIASTADNSTTRTSLYNIIRSMNNNAF